MKAAHFLYKQILALPEKERIEFALLWEESKKEFTPLEKKKSKLSLMTKNEIIDSLKKRGIWK